MKKLLNILLPIITLIPTVVYADVAAPSTPIKELANKNLVYYAVGAGVGVVIVVIITIVVILKKTESR